MVENHPSEKYFSQIGSFPQGSGVKIPKIFEITTHTIIPDNLNDQGIFGVDFSIQSPAFGVFPPNRAASWSLATYQHHTPTLESSSQGWKKALRWQKKNVVKLYGLWPLRKKREQKKKHTVDGSEIWRSPPGVGAKTLQIMG